MDHHISNTEFADHLYLKPEFAATGEIVTDLCTKWNWPITESMGTALYMAIATDCGFFKFSNTTANTLEMAAKCVAAGARPNVISETIEAVSAARLELTKTGYANQLHFIKIIALQPSNYLQRLWLF